MPESIIAVMQPVAQVTVVVPTYNEIDNIQRLVPQLLELNTGPIALCVCVVDDNSPDGTGQYAEAQAARDPRVTVVRRPGKLGWAPPISTACATRWAATPTAC